jgi:hypothetical protein
MAVVFPSFVVGSSSALGKNDPFALGKSDPHQEHDLPAGKETARASSFVTHSFFPNQFVFSGRPNHLHNAK